MNNDNLVSISDRDPETAKAIRRKGAQAANEARRHNKNMKKAAKNFLRMTRRKGRPVDLERVKAIDEAKNLNRSVEEMIVFQQVIAACRGGLKAAMFIRDITGQAPAEQVNITSEVRNPYHGLTHEQLVKIAESDD